MSEYTRDFIKCWRAVGFWRTVWATWFYRPANKLMHRFGLHYAPKNEWLREPQGVLCRCSWCGLSGFVFDAKAMASAATPSWADVSGIYEPLRGAPDQSVSHPEPGAMRSERSERATSLLPAKEGE